MERASVPLMTRLAAILFACLLPALALAEARVALVIGNDDYDAVPKLEKAANDARAMAATLRALDFQVIEALNASRRDMNRALADFTGRVAPGDVAMVFYAGHAIEIEGQNYLLPTDIPDAQPGQEGFVRAEAISLNSVLQRMNATRARLTITVLDSCRDNPFGSAGRSVGGTRGLSRVEPPQGSFILYSAAAGQTALDRLNDDDPHPNSVFTRTLLPLMKTPGLNLVQMAQRVRGEVEDLAQTVRHKQRPAYSDDLDDPFTFVAAPKPTQVSMNDPAQPPRQAAPQTNMEKELWSALGRNPSAADYEAFLQSFPNGVFAPLARARLNALRQAETKPEPPAPEPEPATDDLEARIAAFKREARGPSFDCGKATRTDEFLICASPRLSALDRLLTEDYGKLRRGDRLSADQKRELKARQRLWLKDRQSCSVELCVEAATVRRIRELQAY